MASTTIQSAQAILPEGGGDTEAVDLDGGALVGFETPATLSSFYLTVKASITGAAFHPLYLPNGEPLSIAVSANKQITLNPDLFGLTRYVKFSTVTAEAEARILNVLIREVS